MENSAFGQSPVIEIRPATLFAFAKTCPFLLAAATLMWAAWHYWPVMIWFSVLAAMFAIYRYLYIRRIRYVLTSEYLQLSRGMFFKRIDTIELFKVKTYVLEQSPLLQVLHLMDLQLITMDPINPQVWLRGIPLSNLVEQMRERVSAARKNNRVYVLN